MKRDYTIAYICIITFSILVGFSFIGTKIAVNAASPLETLTARFCISFLCIYLLKKFRIIKVNLSMSDYKVLSTIALFYCIFFFSFQAMGLKYSSSIESGIIFALSPALIAILASIFLKEKPNFYQSISIALSMSGIIYIFVMKGFAIKSASTLGLILLFFSSLSHSIYNVLVRKYKNRFSPFELSYGMFLVATIFYIITLMGNHIINGTLSQLLIPLKNPSFVYAVIYLGLGTTVLTTFLLNRALKSIEAYKAGVFQNVSTIISIFVGIIFLNESFFSHHALGALLILLGVLGTNLFGMKRNKKIE